MKREAPEREILVTGCAAQTSPETFAAMPEVARILGNVEKFRAEELEHRDTGLEHGAEQAPAYEVLTAAIKTGSRLAIWLATRI